MRKHHTGPRLTSPNVQLDRLVWQTHPGQAHWGGTGPAGKQCRECKHFEHRGHRLADGTLAPALCAMYRRLVAAQGKPIPHYALACRHFEQAETVPRISEDTR